MLSILVLILDYAALGLGFKVQALSCNICIYIYIICVHTVLRRYDMHCTIF